MSSLRIAYLISRYPAISHTFVLREVLGLRERGFEIQVASINAPDRPSALLTSDEKSEASRTFYVKDAGFDTLVRAKLAAVVRSPASYFRSLAFAVSLGGSDPKRIALCFFYFVEALLLADWMRKHDLRHLHVHFATPAATVALILTKLAPITMSMTVHGPDEFYDVRGYYLAQKVRACQFVCAISQFARSQLMKISPVEDWGKLLICPLGVDTDQFVPGRTTRPKAAFEVLCVGRLVPSKGQHVLLEALSVLRRQGRSVHVRFVGDGPDRRSLETQAQSLGLMLDATFEGSVNQDRIREFYVAADVFALASFAEGVPVVLMEAMAMEIPCISTWITGIPELIRDGIDGLLVPPGDAETLAAAIARLMDSRETCQGLGEAGRRRVIDKYNLPRNLECLASIFHAQLEAAA